MFHWNIQFKSNIWEPQNTDDFQSKPGAKSWNCVQFCTFYIYLYSHFLQSLNHLYILLIVHAFHFWLLLSLPNLSLLICPQTILSRASDLTEYALPFPFSIKH